MASGTVPYILNVLTVIRKVYGTVSEYLKNAYNYHEFRTESLADDGE